MESKIPTELTEVFLPLALVLVMVVLVIPFGYKMWRNYYLGINSKNEAAWNEMRAKIHSKPIEERTPEIKKIDDDLFDAHTKLLIAEHIKKIEKAKYWTNYFLIFTIIMAAQLAYGISHLLNQYHDIPSIGNIDSTTVQNVMLKVVFTSILIGVYFYKRRGLKEKQILLEGISNEYSVEGVLTLEKLEKLDTGNTKAQSLEITR